MRLLALLAVCGAAFAGITAAAEAGTMHPDLSASLTGMGEHGTVNLTVKSHDLCWTFDVKTTGITAASIRDTGGMVVAKLGSTYSPKSCAMEPVAAIDAIDAKPNSYVVWVDTKGHPGELRGKLAVGMAHM